jgi:hypothetical protein
MKSRQVKASVRSLGPLLMVALALSGCVLPGVVTGGGWIPSADHVAGDKANFGFSVSNCNLATPPTGNFNYHDKTSKFSAPGSVKLAGPITDGGQCVNLPCNTNTDCTAAAGGVCSSNVCLYPGQGFQSCNSNADCTAAAGGSCNDVTLFGHDFGTFCQYPGGVNLGSTGCLLCLVAKVPSTAKTYGFDVNYTSTNPAYPGSGSAFVCVVDNGQGSKAPAKDTALLSVSGGPYDTYENEGSVQGNIAGQSCP